MKKVMGEEARVNKGAEHEPKSGHHRPAPATTPGPERHADMRGALDGNPEDKNPLRGATRELHEQHPIAHHDHGPHHGTDHHKRHMPLHGLKPHGYGR